MTCDMRQMIFLKQKVQKKITKVPKNANKWRKIGEKCQKGGVGEVSIGATICTGQESRCLPYAGFFKKSLDRLTDQQTDFYSCSGKLKSNLSNYLPNTCLSRCVIMEAITFVSI